MAGAREFLNSPKGRVASGAFAIVAFVLLAYFVWQRLGNSNAEISNQRMFVDSTTGLAFGHELVLGESIPVKAPSGGQTGYPSEACYWTKDGAVKIDPTYVILNEYLEKSGPTFCPDCDRLVVGRNPAAGPNVNAPPTRAEYAAQNR